MNLKRRNPDFVGPEKEMLEQFLDWHRTTALIRISGVTDDVLRQPMAASAMSMLGILKHLGYLELDLFQRDFMGTDVPIPWSVEDPDADFRIEPDESTRDVVNFYQHQVRRSREITRAASLDDLSKGDGPVMSLRRMMLHMLEELAQHIGHLDIFREMVDGTRGL